MNFDYSNLEVTIRDDVPEAHRKVWKMIATPGNWWRGEDRVAIAAETRQAMHCECCAVGKKALSPNAVQSEHSAATNLPAPAIDAIHRIVTDASRLSESWLKGLEAKGLTDGHYVELLGIVVGVISIDAFHRAMGLPLEPLPAPEPGEPSGVRPNGLDDMGAWVPMIPPDRLEDSEQDLYGGAKQTGNVIAAMSLVPDSVRILNTLGGAHYLQSAQVANPRSNGGRAISRPQIELIAGRVSSLSDCFY